MEEKRRKVTLMGSHWDGTLATSLSLHHGSGSQPLSRHLISPLKVKSPCIYFIAGGDKNRNPETPYCSARELNPNLWPTLTTRL